MSQKEIIIVRHGKPDSAVNNRINAAEFAQWVRQYNKSPLDPTSHAITTTDLSDYRVLTSTLKRARLLAEKYTGQSGFEAYSLFNEMDIPRYKIKGRLRAWNWVYLNRGLWLAGRKGPFESFSEAKVRALQASYFLDNMATSSPKIALFAHAMTNRFLIKYLQAAGWELTQKDFNFWGLCRLRKG